MTNNHRNLKRIISTKSTLNKALDPKDLWLRSGGCHGAHVYALLLNLPFNQVTDPDIFTDKFPARVICSFLIVLNSEISKRFAERHVVHMPRTLKPSFN